MKTHMKYYSKSNIEFQQKWEPRLLTENGIYVHNLFFLIEESALTAMYHGL